MSRIHRSTQGKTQALLACRLATRTDEVRESQTLRYRVFAEEMGAKLPSPESRLDADAFDPYCHHLLVYDQRSGALAASTRILTCERAEHAGAFYSESEFEAGILLSQPGRFLEIGRTCVAPEFRSGAAITALWRGLSAFVEQGDYRHLIGCASVPAGDGGAQAHAIFRSLQSRHLVPEPYRVSPRHPLPAPAYRAEPARLPPLLRAYLSLGARVGGPPCLDSEFGVADLFIHLQFGELGSRYARHFSTVSGDARSPCARA